jgi:oxygen-independent coproporphyrinogen-3 oxidase
VQNAKTLEAYGAPLEAGELPVARGLSLGDDDLLRRDAIQRLMCDFALDLEALARRHGVDDAAAYFHADLQRLLPLQEAGLLERDGLQLRVTPQGRLLVRVVAMQFDRHLHDAAALLQGPRYSRVI